VLSDTIRARLPATEADILASFGNVSSDYVLTELQRMVRRSDIFRGWDGKYRVFVPPPDDPEEPPPQYIKKTRTCKTCGKTYEGITEHFGGGGGKNCKSCRKPRKRRELRGANGVFSHRWTKK